MIRNRSERPEEKHTSLSCLMLKIGLSRRGMFNELMESTLCCKYEHVLSPGRSRGSATAARGALLAKPAFGNKLRKNRTLRKH